MTQARSGVSRAGAELHDDGARLASTALVFSIGDSGTFASQSAAAFIILALFAHHR